MLVDDLGAPVPVQGPVRRVVSLVPSLTESLATVDRSLLVAATDWCTYPADLEVQRVRGTKNPNVKAIAALAPDVVVANMEENREIDVRRLRDAGVPVWVTRIETVEEALTSIERLVAELLEREPPQWLVHARRIWSDPAPDLGLRVAVPVWRNPWFVVGSRTFASSVLAGCGLTNVWGGDETPRYPTVTIEELASGGVDLVLLPDEPYEFTATDGPDAITVATALIPGRALTWYGPSLLTARDDITGPALAAVGGGRA